MDGETPEEFKARMKSLSYMRRTNLAKEKVITRRDGMVDDGRKAKITTIPSEPGAAGAEITQSDNRQDVNLRPETHYQTIGFQG